MRKYDKMKGNNSRPSNGSEIYNEDFFRKNKKTEYAACKVISLAKELFEINSVTDVGCGRGAWLVECKKNGILDIHGIDGQWNSQEKMLDQSIKFFPMDLSESWAYDYKRDLCLSLEVAEHINPRSSKKFIDSLCRISELVIFSAAYENQGGVGHINERKHSFWAGLFLQNDYQAYDLIRPKYWDDELMDFWYKQNIFFYIKRNSTRSRVAHEAGLIPIGNLSFMNAIHPDLYKVKCEQTLSLGKILKNIGPAAIASIKHRFKK